MNKEHYLRMVEAASENELAREFGSLSEKFIEQKAAIEETQEKKHLVLTRLNEITGEGPDFWEDDCPDDCLEDCSAEAPI